MRTTYIRLLTILVVFTGFGLFMVSDIEAKSDYDAFSQWVELKVANASTSGDTDNDEELMLSLLKEWVENHQTGNKNGQALIQQLYLVWAELSDPGAMQAVVPNLHQLNASLPLKPLPLYNAPSADLMNITTEKQSAVNYTSEINFENSSLQPSPLADVRAHAINAP